MRQQYILKNPIYEGYYGEETLAKKAAKLLVVIALVVLSAAELVAQPLSITQNSNSQTLSQLLAGPGVTISNYTMNCPTNGSGTFTNNSSNLGINGGVVLATGRVQNIPQAANNFASTQFTGSGDANLSTLTTGVIYDPCILQFDVVPQGPLLKFEYVFASEEYPEWVCSQYNDVFGFFITGPNPAGGNYSSQNIALIPDTTLPVAINTINPGSPGANAGGGNCSQVNRSLGFSSYYVNNLSPTVNPNIVYDGMTHVLTVTASVIPCQTYHLKIAIADVGDRIYDSGVFLSAYSFTSNPVSVSATSQLNYAGFSSAYEGCVGGTYTFTLSEPQTVDVHIPLQISGTATNGVDYDSIPSEVIIYAGDTTATVVLNTIVDGIAESAESVTVSVLDPCLGSITSSATITIQDDVPATINASDTALCLGESTQLTANGGLTYVWSPAASLSNPNIKNPVATPTVTTTYEVSMTWGACTKTAQVTVYVSNPAAAISANPAGTVCNGGTVQLTASASNGATPFSFLWSNGSTGPEITAVAAGTYSVTATDAYNCSASASQSVMISNLSLTGTASNVSCMGGNNGAIDITVTGSHAPFTYSWTGGVTSQDRTNLVTGTYSVTVSNTVGCSASATYTITQPSSALTTSATSSPVSCNGGSNGSINLTANGGVSPYTYIWSNAATTQDQNGVTAGSYSVTVTDNNGCTASRSVNVTQPSAIVLSETHTNNNCFGNASGSINLTVSGGISGYAYAWSSGDTTQDVSGLTADNYTVTVSDGNSCTATLTATVSEPTQLSATANGVNPSCFGSANGAVNLIVSGGVSPYTFTWSNAATSQNISGLTSGTFTVTVQDVNSCSATATASITQPSALTAFAVGTNVSCNGGNDGNIMLNVSGGTSPYNFNWSDAVTSQNRTSVAAGTYSVTLQDANSCSASASVSITEPTALSFAEVHTNPACNGNTNGNINITITGGVSPYSFNWNDGSTTEDRTNIGAGAYSVTVTDTRGCSITGSATLTQPTVLSASVTTTNVTCFGGNTGAIDLTVSGGNTPYTFNWGGGVTTEDRTNITAGNYQVTATDSRGCSASASAAITEPGAMTIFSSVTDATCAPGNNGAIDISVTGGTTPYSYDWSGGITTEDRTGLFAGTYSITATDNSGCSATSSISISQVGTGMTLTAVATDASCFGSANGAVDITISGGTAPYNFNWNNTATTEDINSLTAGNYSVTVTDGLGCSAVSGTTVASPPAINLTIDKTDVRCYGESTGSILLTVSGGTGSFTYNWADGATSQNRVNVSAGSYDVTVTDGTGCTATASSIIIAQPSTAVNLSYTSTNVSCYGQNNGMVDLTPAGGTSPYTYDWSNGSISQDLTNVVAGSYSVTVTDANICSASLAVVVTQPTPALAVTLSSTPVTCYGGNDGTITTVATGGTPGYTYNWNGGSTQQNRTSLTAGTYNLTTTDNNGCTTASSIAVAQPSQITIASNVTNVTCHGMSNGSIMLTVSGGTGTYTYSWGGGITTQNRTNLGPGSYTVTVTDASGCTASKTHTITEPSELNISINSGTSVCMTPTGTVTVITNGSGTPPYTYLWSNGGTHKTLTGLPPGMISVTVTDASGACSNADSIYVGLSGNNVDAAFTIAGNYCGPGANLTFTHSGSNNVTSHYWDFGNGIGTSTQSYPTYIYPTPGNYTVTHIAYRGFCTDTDTYPITVFQKPILSSVNSNVSCNGLANGAIDLTAVGTNPLAYNWGGGVTTEDRTNLAPGTYTVTVTDPDACTTTLSATISQPAVLTIANNNTNVTCNGGNNGAINLTVVGGTPTYSYNWGGGITTQNRTNLSGGNYNVTVNDANSCTATAAISVYQPNAISIAPNVVTPACNGENSGSINLTVTGGTGAYAYNWGGGIIIQNRTNLTAGNYAVTVTDANSCSSSLSVNINQPAVLATTLSTTNALCFGMNNGSITSATTGGTSPYIYLWNDGNGLANRSSLYAGTYLVTITDQNTCSVTATTTVTQPVPGITVQVDSWTDVICYGTSTGTIEVTTAGSIAPYTYLWSDSSTLEDRTNLYAGTYFVRAMDQNGCYATASATINQPSAPLNIDTLVVTDVVCNGSSTGQITGTVSGGTSPYTYIWNDGNTNLNRTNLSAGSFELTVTDAYNCSTNATAIISEPTTISASATATNASCNGGSDGTITLTITGGNAPYTFNWGGGVTTQNRINLAAGTYSVTITDSTLCSTTASATISQPVMLAATSTATNISCFAGNNGAISLTVTGGTGAYTFDWGAGITTQNRTNLTAGNYTVTITDANSCSTTHAASVTQPAAALAASSVVGNVSCFGGNNGTITLTTTGGTSPYAFNWGGGVTTQSRTNLTAGNYTVTITDANSCTATHAATITQPAAALAASSTVSNVSCFAGNNGTITLTNTGGTSPYAFNWGGGVTTQNRTSLTAGNYTVTITDANSCTTTHAATITQPAAALAASSVVGNVSCFAGNNGVITLTTTGGTSPYTFNWGGGVTTQNRTNLTAGSYTVTVTDANSCSTTYAATITQPATALAASSVVGNVSCFAGNNGTITVTTTGGTSPYAFNWGGGVTTQNRTSLTAGNYTVTITDANSCTTTYSASLTEPAAALTVTSTVSDVSCFAGNNGSITVSVSGGTTTYSYNWGGGITTQNRTNLTAGSYTVTVTDANACSATNTSSVAQPLAPLSVSLTSVPATCNGASTGTINTNTSGGTSPYIYNWNDGTSTANRNNVTAGNYMVSISDANGCSSSASASVTEPAGIVVSTTTINPTCHAGNDGEVNTATTGGTTPYSYDWGSGITTQDYKNLTAGTYAVTITDANMCSTSISATLSEPSPFVLNITITQVSCNGASDGEADLTCIGSTPGYTYMWSTGWTGEDLVDAPAGNYGVTIYDQNNCQIDTNITITQPTTISVTETHTAVSCNSGNNGSIDITVIGGIPPYNFTWNDGASTEDRNNLSAGTYQISVNDNNSCAISRPILVTEPTAINVSLTATNVLCNGGNTGAITSSVNGGTGTFNYLWSNGASSTNISNATAGSYILSVTDANNCPASSSINLSEPSQALGIISSVSNVACYGDSTGSITLQVSGGTSAYTYNWGNGIVSQNRTQLPSGTYRVTVTDANACSTTASMAVSQPSAPLNSLGIPTSVSCFGGNDGAVTLNTVGGTTPYFYNWGGGNNSQNRTALVAGTYSVTVTDAKSCSTTASAIVTQPSAPLTANTTVSNVSCYSGTNGSITLSVSGGSPSYSYAWSDGFASANRSNLTANQYSVTVTDNRNCTITASASVSQPSAPLSAATTSTNVACHGDATGAIYLTSAGGTSPYNYNWGGGVTTQNRVGITAGNYQVIVTDAHQCTASASVIITQPTNALQVVTNATHVNCYGNSNGTISTMVSGGTSTYSYFWNDGATSSNRNGLQAGSYRVTITDANSCSTTGNAIVNQPPQLNASLTPSPVLCHGDSTGSVNLTISGGVAPYTYLWNNNATTEDISSLSAASYSVSVSDANACNTSRAASVTEPSSLAFTISATDVACSGGNNGAVNVSVTGGVQPYHYIWNNNATTEDLINIGEGSYSVVITDDNGCYGSVSATINTLPQLDVTGVTNPLPCENAVGIIDLTVGAGTPPFSFSWSNGATSEDLTDVHPGIYSVVVHDANGCPFDTTFEIENLNQFSVDATGGGTVKLGETVELHVTSTGSLLTSYEWTPSFGMDCNTCIDVVVQPGHPTVYTVVGIDTNGCIAQDTVSVNVIDDYTIFTPNAFTPNGDGNNDYFQIYGNLQGIKKFDLMIFDRWGEKVYDSSTPDFKWDGIYKGELLPPAVYVYVMKAVFLDGHSDKVYKGSITIIR